ncbi:hypothetical protein B6N60_02307 [Richelia sinica FACHB-800]|uniref:Tetratricopeptide repeat protein n=1 Tax=Richelia sinica FACHB-800 TaxID=1357546 RepID=A0A975T7L3_9NOST|nr:tetratricopeptide repeat protein [Richelia sinica]MBD2665799.1 tetratricopeptide repeat protein [Richelia sinica FACHB-800]QXE23617.1 hypothetical protein B6N60_02307 [Richelia sinica FACHB-800]
MSVNETIHTENFAWNRQVYQRLKLALSLGLRRQILLAVCDDLHLRNQIAARLHSTLAYPVGQVLYQPGDGGGISTPAYPRLVTLRLNVNDPNPMVQINQWLANYPPPIVGASSENPGRSLPIPAFQIVGVELLTKQPVAVQRLFLHYLRLSEQYFSNQESSQFLETSLLFWLPRPWFYAIQQSATKFWHYRTGVFVFAGEPTPTVDNRGYPEHFANGHSLDLGNLQDESILNESGSPSLNSNSLEDFSLSTEEHTSQPEPVHNATNSEVLPVNVPHENNHNQPTSFSHISHELAELVKATISNNINQNGDEQWQPQQLLWVIEQLHEKQATPAEIGAAYQNLGNLYRLRIEQGQSTIENLMVAILAYQEAVTYDDNSPKLPDILNDLGTLYWMLHRTPGTSEEGQVCIQQGIEFYHLALKLISSTVQPDTYARVQNNLGTAYGDLARFGQPVENWQKAIAAYQKAIKYRTASTDPLKYAACQNNLGTAYWHLGQNIEPVENLKQAIAAYNDALTYYQPEDEPLKYGMIQNNIGTAYWNLAQYEQPLENLQLAIGVYQEALKYRTPENAPHACAATQNNLGTAYWHLANLLPNNPEERHKYLQLCIHAYTEAVTIAKILSPSSLNFDLLVTHNNLGLAHYQLVTDSAITVDRNTLSQHLESALDNHVFALNGMAEKTEIYQTTFNYIVKVIRTFHNSLGVQGQNLALSKIPGKLMPEILPKL